MITRYTPPFRTTTPPQWRGACAAVAGGGPNRATAIIVARLVFTISWQSRAFTALRLIDLVTAMHSHLNELATLEFGLQQLARLEDDQAIRPSSTRYSRKPYMVGPLSSATPIQKPSRSPSTWRHA
ncbi:MAG: hypothetical protein ABW003_04735 [Microvirga sp.]